MNTNTFVLKFNEVWANIKELFFEFIPNIVLSVFVLILGYLIGRVLKFLVSRFIAYLHRLLTQRFSGSIRYINLERSADFIGKIFFWFVLICTFVLISDILGFHLITTWLESILQYSPNLLAAILIVVIAVIGGRTVGDILSSLGDKAGLNYGKTLGRVAQYLILVTAIIIAIDQIGIEVAILINIINIGLAALLFGSALAFGLGARTAVSNILSTFYVRKMFKVGDKIKIDDIEGRITKIDDNSVVIDTQAGQAIIPSKLFSESKSFLIYQDQQL